MCKILQKIKRKLSNKENHPLDKYLLVLIIAGAILLYSINGYNIGFHNSDLGQNMKYLSVKYNMSLRDWASDFNSYSPTELYIIGENQRTKYFWTIIGSSYLVGYCIACLNKGLSQSSGGKN